MRLRLALLKALSARLQAALDEQSKAADAAAQRHLAFIDRLLADKESLAQQCAQQAPLALPLVPPAPQVDWVAFSAASPRYLAEVVAQLEVVLLWII